MPWGNLLKLGLDDCAVYSLATGWLSNGYHHNLWEASAMGWHSRACGWQKHRWFIVVSLMWLCEILSRENTTLGSCLWIGLLSSPALKFIERHRKPRESRRQSSHDRPDTTIEKDERNSNSNIANRFRLARFRRVWRRCDYYAYYQAAQAVG